MSTTSWNYVDVNCNQCAISSRIRIDQFNRKGKTWICRSCSFTGRKLNIKNKSAKHDPEKLGSWKSYWRAKKRVQENHHNAYSDVEFRFKNFEEFWEELGKRPDGKSLDRINPWGNYEKGNVRWATHVEQCNNRRRHHPNPKNGDLNG